MPNNCKSLLPCKSQAFENCKIMRFKEIDVGGACGTNGGEEERV
jgi:hypothetical protein